MKKLLAAIILIVTTSSFCYAQIIDHFAGSTKPGWTGDGGPASSAEIFYPFNMESDAAGNLYFSEVGNHIIRKVDSRGIISTVVGTSQNAGFAGDGGPATSAKLNNPTGIAVDKNGIIYIADWLNHRIRKTDAAGRITTIAGTGVIGYSGDGGPAINAKLNLDGAVDLALDSRGNLYITQPALFVVRKIDPAGIITTVIGNGTKGYSGDNGNALNAQLSLPNGIAIDKNDNIYVADAGSNTVRKITPAGIITTFAGGAGTGYAGDGGPATSAKFQIGSPTGVATDGCGNLYIADYSNHVIRKIDAAGIITTVAGNNVGNVTGNGGPATAASIWFPANVAVDPANNFYIPDAFNNTIRKVTIAGDASISNITLTSDNPGLCEGSKLTFKATIVNEAAVSRYEWFVNGALTNVTSKQFESTALKNGDKVKLIIVPNGSACTAGPNPKSMEMVVGLKISPKPLLADRETICSREGHILDPGEFKSYLWHDGSTGRTFEARDKGLYFVTVTNESGCTGSDTAEIRSLVASPTVALPADTLVCEGTILTIRPDRTFSSYLWSDGSTNNTLKVNRAGTYSVEVSDANNCKARDSMVLNYKTCVFADQVLAAPNAFTPNSDGLNDFFRPKIPGVISGYQFSVYNRWGQMVFETRDRNKAWNGGISTSDTSSDISSNTFTWVCVYIDEAGKKIVSKGTVILIR
ncbi:NHL domain-containing protein [Flavitalea antarctica]